MATLGERIRNVLKEKNLTQRQLAEQVGCTEAAISHYIKGDRFPRSSVMSQLAISLGVSVDYLMVGTPQNKDAEVGYAKKLIARNAEHMTREEKLEIIDILMGDNNG